MIISPAKKVCPPDSGKPIFLFIIFVSEYTIHISNSLFLEMMIDVKCQIVKTEKIIII